MKVYQYPQFFLYSEQRFQGMSTAEFRKAILRRVFN